MADLAWWLANFQRSAFRLEMLPAYFIPQEAELLAAFRRGENVRVPYDHPWPALVHQATHAGKTMQRVRVVAHPLSDYLRFELSLYPRSVKAGEEIRVANLDDHPEPTDLARALLIPKPSVTFMVKRLEKAGYLRRQLHPTDLRRFHLSLTPPGRRAMEQARDILDEAFGQRLARLGRSERAELIRLLQKMSIEP